MHKPSAHLLLNARVYAPDDLGIQDILIVNDKIMAMGKLQNEISLPGLITSDLQGQTVVPGFIDQHVHLIGGGGEGGFATQTPEYQVTSAVKYGVTSVLGLLGTDSDTRHPASLNAKTRALTEEGISAWMLTGAYNIPSPTITGNVRNDILYAERCIGLKLAISDHRAPHVSFEEFIRLASDCRIAGMLSGKAGTMTLHLGDAPQGLELLFRSQRDAAVPAQQFIPTHINRNKNLFEEALKWGKQGGRIDISAGFDIGNDIVKTFDGIMAAREAGITEENITLSTDAQGSMPEFDEQGRMTGIGVAQQDGLLDIVQQQVAAGIPLSTALKPVTETVANWLKLPGKGQLTVGNDADLLVLDDNLNLQQTMAKGKIVFADGEPLIRNMFM